MPSRRLFKATHYASYACTDGTAIDTIVPARANRSSVTSHRAVPTGDEKRGEFSIEGACSDANLERFTKGLDQGLGEMTKRRFVPDGEREITDNDMLHALACRLVITEKDDGHQSSTSSQGSQMQAFCRHC